VRGRSARGAPLAALGIGVLSVAAYVLTYALDATAYLNDEYGTVMAGRGMARDPGEILSAAGGGLSRGPERLTAVVLALPAALLESSPDELRAGHVLLALAYALTAVPAYALLRGLDVPRWPAAGLSFAAIAGPWAVFGATFLNVTLAAPLTVAFVWAAWRAVVRPSLRGELAAVGVAALMTTARASHAVFFAAAALAAVAAAWWTRPAGARLRRLPGLVLRRSPAIAGATLAGVAAVAAIGPRSLAGERYADAARIHLPLDALWDRLGWGWAALAVATGFVALPVGGAWALRQLARPADLRTGAFAVLAVAVVLLDVYIAAASGADEQERYAAVLATLPLVAFGAALFRRGEAWVLGTALLGLLAARAIATRTFSGADGAADSLAHLFAPAELFFSRAVVGRLTVMLPGDGHMVAIATLAAAAVAVLVAALCARRAVAAAAVVAVAAIGVVAGGYTLRKYEPATAPGDLERAAWLDRATGGEDTVFWNYQWPGNGPDRDFRTRLTLFHNASACCGEWHADPSVFVGRGGRIEREPVPRYVAGHDGFRPVVFAAVETARPRVFGVEMRVERFAGARPMAAAVVLGSALDGAVGPRTGIVATPALDGRCLDVQLYTRRQVTGSVGFAVGRHRGRLAPGESRSVRVRGTVLVRRTGPPRGKLHIGEIHYVDCGAPPAR
jgi:hypothetical protein